MAPATCSIARRWRGLASSLANNGGTTPTLAAAHRQCDDWYRSYSVSGISTDQRGISLAAPPDIGAFQLETVTSSTAGLPVTATSLTILGSAFDTTASHDSVSFGNGVTGSVTAATSTSLTVNLIGWSTQVGGTALHAGVTVDGVGISSVQVATAAPVVTSSAAYINATATSMTIAGFGFDTTFAAHDSVTFNDGVTGTVMSATGTSLTVSLTGWTTVAPGTALTASLTVDGSNSGSPRSGGYGKW